jgi:hypothetical protein
MSKIVSNVPPPDHTVHKFMEEYSSMKVNDSFVVGTESDRIYFLVTYKRIGKTEGKSFASRLIKEGKDKGKYRIWRIS